MDLASWELKKMPLREYSCCFCGGRVEVLQPNGEGPPMCCGREMKKLISVPAGGVIGAGYPYVEHNMGPEPVVVESPGQRKRLLKKRGLVEAGAGKGRPGCWA